MSSATAHPSIGRCTRAATHKGAPCDGPLCVSSRMDETDGPPDPHTGQRPRVRRAVVACERCGHEHPDHWLLAGERAAAEARKAREAAPEALIPSADFGHSQAERITLLEQKSAELDALKAELAELRAVLGKKKGGA